MASIASLRVPIAALPQINNTSFLSSIADSLGTGIDQFAARRDIKSALEQSASPPAVSQGGFLSKLTGQQQRTAKPVGVPPVGKVTRGQPQGSTYQPFIDTVRAGGVTNPNALAAIAATGRAESGWSPQNATRTWSDPSQSGQPGTAGGILSWRGPRYQALAAKGDLSPEGQAKFFLQENPQLIEALNGAQSPEQAADLMANAWKFAGYDQQGGEAARRRALARNYYAQEFANQPIGAAAAIEAQAPGGMGSPLTDQSFDNRFGQTALPAEVAQGRDGLAAALAEGNQTGALPQQPDQTPQVQPTAYAPNQVADASGSSVAAGVQPVQRGTIDPALIARLVTNPQSREFGLALWKQNVTGSTGEPWQFVKAADGTLLRANQQTGAIEPIGNYGKDPSGLGAGEAGLNLVYGQDADGNTVAFQPLKGGGIRQVELPNGIKLTPGISNIDTGTGTLTVNSKTGARVAETPKDLSGAEREKGTGKNAAESAAALPQVESSVQQMLASIDSLNKDPYLASMLGPVNSRLPSLTGDAARVQSKLDQITGQAFLQAYNSLRGGGQITEVEGKKATEAMGRLNTAQNEADFRQALQEIRDVLNSARERALRSAGKTAPAANQTRSGVQWKIEE